MYQELKIVRLSSGKIINLEELNCLMKVTTAELEELLAILRVSRMARKTSKPIPPVIMGQYDYQEGN